MTKQDAYRIVYNDILNRDVRLFLGCFDAKNGSKNYMHGIETVMEFIAYECSEAEHESFQEIFFKNFQESLDKARQK